jgi:hypothetical protein
MGLIGESEILFAGPSNAGFADPGHASALSLLAISSALLTVHPTLDYMVFVGVMRILVDEIGDALLAAHKKMVAEESAARK